MSDVVTQTWITAVFGFLTTLALGVLAYLQAKQNGMVHRAAEKVAEVKDVLAENTAATNVSLAGLQKTTDEVHALVNSPMLVALQSVAKALRRIADMTHNEVDIEAAIRAEKASDDQTEKQSRS